MEQFATRQEFEELRGRITLLEGGNNEVLATKDDLKNLHIEELIEANGEIEYVSK